MYFEIDWSSHSLTHSLTHSLVSRRRATLLALLCRNTPPRRHAGGGGAARGAVSSPPTPSCVWARLGSTLISHRVFIRWFWKVNSLTKLSTYFLLLLIETISRRFCGGVDFWKLINEYILWDEPGAFHAKGLHAWAPRMEVLKGLTREVLWRYLIH